MASELAVLGGGCFWCVEAVFQQLRGVTRVQNGYAGGERPHPTYEQVCQGNTGHIEVVQVEFNPTQISFRQILEVFFAVHDPTTPNRQGHDVGEQYRSAIFYQSEAQKQTAEQVVAEVQRHFSQPIVTLLLPSAHFWPAESYHDSYYLKHPEQGYCSLVIQPKMAKFRSQFALLLK